MPSCLAALPGVMLASTSQRNADSRRGVEMRNVVANLVGRNLLLRGLIACNVPSNSARVPHPLGEPSDKSSEHRGS